jgi:hypothetical protein
MTKRRTTTVLARSISNPGQATLIIPSTLTNDIQHQSYLATSVYSTMDAYHARGSSLNDDDDDFDSLQYQFSSYGPEAFKLFELFVRKLNDTKHLQYILYHWTIGNRITIKYTNQTDNKDWICILVSVFRVRFNKCSCFP